MVISQAFNRRTQAWVKYKFVKGKGSTVLDVKQKNPRVPFAGIEIRGQRPKRERLNNFEKLIK